MTLQMTQRAILCCFMIVLFSGFKLWAQPDSLMIFQFEEGQTPSSEWVKTNDASFEISNNNNNNNNNNNHVLKVMTGHTILTPGVTLLRTEENNWDLTGYYLVKADVCNLSDKDIQVEMFVGNDPDGLIRWFCSDYIDLKPNQTGTISVPMAWTPWIYSPQLEVVAMRGVPGKLKTDQKAIAQFQFNTRYATSPSVFTVDNIRAIGRLEVRDTTGFFPFVDKFGQYKHKEWQGKIHKASDLKEQNKKELAELEQNATAPDRGKFGGWTAGPKLKATGFFHPEKYRGKWWLVDPEGYLFWTAGVNCVSSQTGTTSIQQREKYFEDLPSPEGDYKDFYKTYQRRSSGVYKTFNFYEANLYRKFGKDWLDQFRNRIHDRFKSWGLNTIGFVSDFGAALQHKTPYVGSVWIHGTPKIEGSEGYWGKFHDVFDPKFRSIVREAMNDQKKGANDPWCIGYFVDNEMSWGLAGSLAIATLKSPADQPAKIEFVNDLKDKYKSIDQLNKAWKTSHVSWKELLECTEAPNENYAKKDLLSFYEKIAMTYFRTVKEELNRIAPNQNYLGCRFAWANNDYTLRAAAKYCDIVSFNKYEFSIENVGMPEGVDKPIMIGEFHFGSTERGYYHPGVKAVANLKERGIAYQNYIQGALRNPLIVGAHWFQYTDQPLTGRGDGENYNVGLIDITDTPYPAMVEKIRETCYSMYEYRLKH